MPLFIRLPKNDHYLMRRSAYRSHLDMLDRKETAVQRILLRGGLAAYEPTFQATVMALCELAPAPLVFYDLGAHIGLYSALVGAIFPGARCIAFEPTPQTAGICARLCRKNSIPIELVQKAVSSRSGSLDFYLSAKAETSNSLNPAFRPGATVIQVEAIRLDDFNGPTPSVLKLDLETHDPEALLGAKGTIEATRPPIVCEFLRLTSEERTAEVLSWLQAIGYRFYSLKHATPWPERSQAQVASDVKANARRWLLAPTSLREDFYAALRLWMAAIGQCGPETNILVPSGTPPPHECSALWTA